MTKERESLIEVDLARAEVFRVNVEIARVNLTGAKLDLARRQEEFDREHAQDFHHHTFTLAGGINGSSVSQVIETLGMWSRMDGAEPKPMELRIHSPGGEVLSGMALFDELTRLANHGHHMTTTVLGYAASMASILVQAGTTRVMGRESYLLIHEMSSIAVGKIGEIEDMAEVMQKMQDRVLEIFLTRSAGRISKASFVKHWKRKDWWVDSQECLKWGFVDEVR